MNFHDGRHDDDDSKVTASSVAALLGIIITKNDIGQRQKNDGLQSLFRTDEEAANENCNLPVHLHARMR
jgi:hypothetical protein